MRKRSPKESFLKFSKVHFLRVGLAFLIRIAGNTTTATSKQEKSHGTDPKLHQLPLQHQLPRNLPPSNNLNLQQHRPTRKIRNSHPNTEMDSFRRPLILNSQANMEMWEPAIPIIVLHDLVPPKSLVHPQRGLQYLEILTRFLI